MNRCLILSPCILLFSISLWAQGVQPSAVALTPAIEVNQGVISQPLMLKVTGVGTSTPLASLPIEFSTDSTGLVLIDQSNVTDASGQASAICIGLRPGVWHVIAMLPTGGLLKFQVTVVGSSTAVPQFTVPDIGRMAWQGTSTVDSGDPFVATLAGSSAAPVANAAVIVSVLQGNVQLLDGTGAPVSALSLTTQADGSIAFHASFPLSSSPDDFSVIGLSAQGTSSVFLVHAFPKNAPPVLQAVGSSNSGPILLIDGAPSATPVLLKLVDGTGQGVSGVTADLIGTADRQAACAESLLITAGDGTLTCHLVVRGKTGNGTMSFVFGQQLVSPAVAYLVSPSDVALIRQVSGNYQSGSGGQLLPIPLQIELIDAFGNPVAGSPVVWQSNNAVIIKSDPLSNASGLASATVQLGTQAGSMSATASVAGASATFQMNNTSSGRLVKSGGDGQVATVQSPFLQLLQVRLLSAAGQAVPGQLIEFAVTGGSASLNASSAITDSNGYASISVTAGNTPGLVSVQASNPSDRETFVLSVVRPLAQTLALGDANGQSAGLTPGSIATLRFAVVDATDYTPQEFQGAPYPAEVQGYSVKINGAVVPILGIATSAGQMLMSVQVPWETKPSAQATVVLTRAEAGVIASDVKVIASRPVVLSTGMARVLRTVDGNTLTLQVTGMGQYTPLASTNSEGFPGQTLNQPFQVLMDGESVAVTRVLPSPELSGVLNVTLRLPVAQRRGVHSFVAQVPSPSGWITGPPTELQLH